MQNVCFAEIAANVFNNIQKKYMLTLKVRNDVLNYSNKIVNFSLYFEHRFEIYICFHHRNSNLRLIDILKWLDFHENDVTLVSRNQISCVSDIDVVLQNLCAVMDKFLGMLYITPELLSRYLDRQVVKETTDVMLSHLRQAWELRDYEKFLMLVESQRDTIKDAVDAELIFKQASYAKKVLSRKTEDG